MAKSATTEASETLIEAEPSTQAMDLEIPIAATEEQLAAADSKRSRENSGGAKKLKVEKSAEEDRLDQLERTEGDKESDRVSVGPKNFGSSVEMFDYFYKFLHYWPPNVNVNKALCGIPLSKKCKELQALPPPPTFQQDENSDKSSGFSWQVVVMGYGCGFVFGIVTGYLMFLTRSPKWLMKIVEGKQYKKVKSPRRAPTDAVKEEISKNKWRLLEWLMKIVEGGQYKKVKRSKKSTH